MCPDGDAPAPWPPVPNPRTSVPPTASWPEPVPAPPPAAPEPAAAPRKRRARPAIVIGVVVALLAIGGVTAFVITQNDDHPPQRASEPNMPAGVAPPGGVTYQSQDRRVSAKLPVVPQVTSLPAPVNGTVAVATQQTYERLFIELHPGAVAAAQVRSTLRSHVSIAVGIAGAQLNQTSDTTFRGYLAVRGTGTFHGDPLEFLAFSANGVEYGLVVHSRYFAATQMKLFEDSLRIRR